MKFERIDEKTVKCFLSNEELQEYEISYKDLLMRNDKARDMLEDVIRQAGEEMGYEMFQAAFDLSVMLLPEMGMVLTFSERGADPEALERSMVESIMEARKAYGKEAPDEVPHWEDGLQGEAKAGQPGGTEEGRQQRSVPSREAVFCFTGLRQLASYAEGLQGGQRMNSSLYELDGMYFLFLEMGEASYEYYSRACIRALEFGRLHSAEPNRMRYIREHGTCVIREAAVQKLMLT